MSELEPKVAEVIEAYKQAAAARDIDAFMRIYDPAARVFDAWGVWSFEGVAPWRAAIESWFASHPADRLQVTFEDVSSVSDAAFASVSAIVTYAIVTTQGAPLHAMHNRLTWVLKKDGSGLRVIHEHTSVPVGFEDMKAILQRETGNPQ
ncbi:MAG: nuclear transport factor 2 family protein [Planctomycetaceae bacterium]|nr:nuclear transport factor 2 family protein [Planctomycetaceae bacterium]